MSARRWFGGAALAALVALASATGAEGQIVARVGGSLAGKAGDTLEVPVTVDLRGAPGVRLGSYRMALRFNSHVLAWMGIANGTFAPPLVNSDSSYGGASAMVRLTAVQPSGVDSVVTLFVARFMVAADTGQSDITVGFDEMSAAGTFADLLPSLSIVNATFCHALGRWGDVDGDGRANSRDALVALSKVVGLRLDTLQIIPIDTTRSDTVVTMRPSLADVDGDGQVTSRDALIIVSWAVGLPVPGFRIGLAAAGACASGLGVTLAAWPDTLELQTGQSATVVVSALDGTGQPASLNGATWTSGNTAVAGATSGFGVVARDPGTAVLTVRLGASYSASMVVKVIARRTQWHVDVARVQAAVQTGSAAFPFAFIQDAFNAGQDNDTIDVAAGRYEEAVASDISVFLRGGDPANPPVIDPRGAYYYSPYTAALSTGSRAAPMVIENLAIRGGHVVINAHDLFARRLHIEGDTLVAPLYFASAPSLASSDTGNLVLDSVTIHGYPDGVHGIEIPIADTVIIRNSAVTRDAPGNAVCYPHITAAAGISVQHADYTEVRNTAVVNSPCMGVAVRQPTGSAVFSRNRIVGLAGPGFAATVPHLAFDHNLIRDARVPGYYNPGASGIWITSDEAVQSVTSLADTIRNVGDFGIQVQSAAVVTIDSLVADSISQDGAYNAAVDVYNARTKVTNSRIADVNQSPGVSVWVSQLNNRAVLESRHNVIERIGAEGLFTSQYGSRPMAPRVLAGPPVQRGPEGGSNYGPDTLISVGDTVRGANFEGIRAEAGLHLLVDSTVVDSIGGYGIYGYTMGRVTVHASRVTRNAGWGMYLYPVDTAVVTASVVENNSQDGIFFGGGSGTLTVDSSRIAGNGRAAVYTTCSYCLGAANITRSTISGNALGLVSDGYAGGIAIRARGNNITGNATGGATNYGIQYSGPVLDADTNYWGDANGPRCSGTATGCDSASVAGDFILSNGVSFAGWLTASATNVMTAPRLVGPVAAAVAALPAPQPPAAAREPVPVPAATRPAEPQVQPRPPLIGWRKGRAPAPVRVHHPT